MSVDDHLRQTSTATGVAYFLTDHLGTMSALTDASGNVVETLAYDSFGNNGGSTRTRYTYTERERDPDTGLLYYRARFYDPQLGRFISEDPIGFAGGDVNLYGYVWQNPLRHTDPSGLDGGLAPSDLADAIDAQLERLRRYLTGLDPDAVNANTVLNYAFNNYKGAADLLRVGWGFGNYYYGKPCTVPADELFKDIGRASGIALLLAGTAQGILPGPPRIGYMPFDPEGNPIPLPKQTVGGVDIPTPLPEAQGPHTTLGTRIGNDGIPYRQSAEFPGPSWPKLNGQDVPLSRVDWTDHGRPGVHSNPHQHIISPTGPGGTWITGPGTPFWKLWW